MGTCAHSAAQALARLRSGTDFKEVPVPVHPKDVRLALKKVPGPACTLIDFFSSFSTQAVGSA